MTSQVVFCRPNDSENHAAQLMWEHDCGVLPVVDDAEHVVGIITDRDLCMSAYTSGQCLKDVPVSKSMSTQVFTCSPSDTLETALGVMGKNRLRRVPIVDDKHELIGILSLNDIVRHIAQLSGGENRRRLESSLIQAMASICQRRERGNGKVLVPAEAPATAKKPLASKPSASKKGAKRSSSSKSSPRA